MSTPDREAEEQALRERLSSPPGALPESWFERNVGTIRTGMVVVCVGLLIADVIFQFVGHRHTHFAVEEIPGFYALTGFVSYVFLVLTAKQLRKLVMRPTDYYGEDVPSVEPPTPHEHHEDGEGS